MGRAKKMRSALYKEQLVHDELLKRVKKDLKEKEDSKKKENEGNSKNNSNSIA